MSAKIEPALTPEGWAREVERNAIIREAGTGFVAPLPDDLFDKNEGEVGLAGNALLVGFDTGAGWQVVPDRKKAAALALYGQPFGFTREDVEHLRKAARTQDFGDSAADGTELDSIADRIEALLPPGPW